MKDHFYFGLLSLFLFIPFFLFISFSLFIFWFFSSIVAFLLFTYILLVAWAQHLWDSFFTFAFQHQAFDCLNLREYFSLPLPPSVEGDPWSGYRRIIFISVIGWWKMVISHLKHSYLNWKVNPCRRKMIAVFHRFLNIFFLAFLIFI